METTHHCSNLRRELPVEKKRHYLGGMEFKNDLPEAYNFGGGRVVFRIRYRNFA